MPRTAEDDHLSAAPSHLLVAAPDTSLEGKDYGAGGVDEVYAQLAGSGVGRGRLAVGADEHLLASEGGKGGVVNDTQPHLREALHLGTVVHYIAQTIEGAVAAQLLLGSADSLHHTETVTCIIVNPYLH